eukprot:4988474-Pyramimonas_sp.AAC.2
MNKVTILPLERGISALTTTHQVGQQQSDNINMLTSSASASSLISPSLFPLSPPSRGPWGASLACPRLPAPPARFACRSACRPLRTTEAEGGSGGASAPRRFSARSVSFSVWCGISSASMLFVAFTFARALP